MKFWLRIIKKLVLSIVVLMTIVSLLLYIFEDRIIQKVVAQVNTYLKEPVKVAQIDLHFWRTFPNLSVSFENVLIADPLEPKDTLLNAQQISLRFNPFDIWEGQYHIERISSINGRLQLKTDSKGRGNYDIFKDTSSSDSAFDLELETILLEQYKVSYIDKQSSHSYHTSVRSASLSGKFSAQKTTLKATGDIWLNQIKKGKVLLLRNEPLIFDLALLVDQSQNLIKLPQAQFKLAKLPFLIDAEFGPVNSSLDIRSQNLSLVQLVRTIQPASLPDLKRVKAEGKVDFQLHYEDAIDRSKPLIQAYFRIDEGHLTEPKFGAKIHDLHCLGTYSNADTDDLDIEEFAFKTNGAQFFGRLKLSNFIQPKLSINAKGKVPLSLVQAFYPLTYVKELRGDSNLKISAQMKQDDQSNWFIQAIEGDVDVKATIGSSDLAAQIQIAQHSVQLSTATPLMLKGKFQSKILNMADFDTPSNGQKRDWILPQNISLQMPIDVAAFHYNGKKLSQLRADLSISPSQISIQQLQFNHAQGLWKGQVKLLERSPSLMEIQTKGFAKQIAISQLFKEWNNFDQSILTSDQIDGTGNFEFEVGTQYDLVTGIDESSLQARVHCILDNGRLLHAPILQDLAHTLTIGKGKAILGTKNQAALQQKLKDVRFKRLENTFYISKRQLSFEKMHIASTALDLDLVGKHSFEHDIDYSVGLRLRDLLIQETQTEFGEILDDGTGLRLFVRISGSLDNPKVSWDKKGKKEAAQQQFERSQQESKEMLKSAFGLYKNDQSVGTYQEQKNPHETIQIKFKSKDNSESKTNSQKAAAPKKNRLQQKLEKWKEEQEQTGVDVKIKGLH